MKFKVLNRRRIFNDFLKIDEAEVQFERFDGTETGPVRRLCMMRGDAVVAVVHDVENAQVLLVRQFRLPTVEKSDGWPLELVAGMLSAGEDPEDAMRREIEEEIGYSVSHLEPIGTVFASPGGSDERLFMYYAAVSPADKRSDGGGLAEEHEDIALEHLPIKDLEAFLDSGETLDAKTYVGLSWFLRKKCS